MKKENQMMSEGLEGGFIWIVAVSLIFLVSSDLALIALGIWIIVKCKRRGIRTFLKGYIWQITFFISLLISLINNIYASTWLSVWISLFLFHGVVVGILFYLLVEHSYLSLTKTKSERLKKNSISIGVNDMKELKLPRVLRVLLCIIGVIVISYQFFLYSIPIYKHTFVSLVYKDTSEKKVHTVKEFSRRDHSNTVYIEYREGPFYSLKSSINVEYRPKKGEQFFFHFLSFPLDGRVLEYYPVDTQGNRIDLATLETLRDKRNAE